MLCCSKKTLKLKQAVPPPKTPDPVDGRRHIELQARCLQSASALLIRLVSIVCNRLLG